MRIRVQPYKPGSRSARTVARALGRRLIRVRNTRFRARPSDVIINWGSTELMFPAARYINHPEKVAVAGHKHWALATMQAAGVTVPPFTVDHREAEEWLRDGATVISRTLLRANSGRGLVINEPSNYPYLEPAPLYTKYVKKFDEYRVHVAGGQVIDIQQKRRRLDHEREIDSRVRNTAGGWIFARGDIDCPRVVIEQGLGAVRALGLDFGAADVGFTRRSAVATVYEVNTAPGVEGTTVRSYHDALRRIVAGLRD